ncbi:MAG TPA: heme-binding protein [Dermatophilaceae bacterium]|nr:heme-binding protein [Dermatophilaceae bacterium]
MQDAVDATTTQESSLTRRGALGLAAAAGAVGSTVLAAPAAVAEGATAGVRKATPMPTITLALADLITKKAVGYVRRNSLPPMFVVVVDSCGDEKASARMDGNGTASTVLVPVKARTAAAFKSSTADLAARVTAPAAIASFTTAGFSLLGGGVPVVVDGNVIGAVGVGGGSPDQDDQVARAAVAAALA